MEKSKKQSWIEKNTGWCITTSILLILFLLWLTYINSVSYICSKNSEKCVCQSFKQKCAEGDEQLPNGNCIIEKGQNGKPNYIFDFEGENKCTKFRLKSELDIQSCQENPREDDICKCLKYNPYCTNCAEINTDCFESRPKTECEKGKC